MFVGYRVGSGPARSIRQWWEAPVFTERTSIGLDVHARSVVAAAIDGVTGEVSQTRLTPSYEHIHDRTRPTPRKPHDAHIAHQASPGPQL